MSGGVALNWTCADRFRALVHMFELPKPDVIVYGLLPSEWYGRWLLPYKTDQDGRVYFFQAIDDAVGMHESEAALFILPFEAGATMSTTGQPKSAPLASCDETLFAALCKVIPLSLQHGSLVCFLIRPSTPIPYFSQAQVPEYKRNDTLTGAEIQALLRFHDNVIGHRLLEEAQARLEPSFLCWIPTFILAWVSFPHSSRSMPRQRSRMKPVGGRFGERTTVIATLRDDNVVGMAREIGRGMLFWLPARNPTSEEDCIGAMATLAKCLFTFQSKRLSEEPSWVKDQSCGQARRRRGGSGRMLNRPLRPARPPWRCSPDLGASCGRETRRSRATSLSFLREMGLSVEADEQYKEDFWLVAGGERAVIGEVKAVNGNVTPSDLAHVVSHRKEAGKPDEFPALFVANTFANTEKVDKRRIEPNVCRRAREDNVLLMRTVDLARFYDGMTKQVGGFDLDTLWTQLRSGGGWLQVDGDCASLRTA